jgi:hypothetical protein
MPNVAMQHEKDPRQALLEQAGDVSRFEICDNEVLIAIYMRPEKTKGGIVMVPRNLQEDLYQSKIGLVLRIGPTCDFPLVKIELYDWVLVRPSDGYNLEVNFLPCRLAYDKHVRVKVPDPEMIW